MYSREPMSAPAYAVKSTLQSCVAVGATLTLRPWIRPHYKVCVCSQMEAVVLQKHIAKSLRGLHLLETFGFSVSSSEFRITGFRFKVSGL